MRLVQGTLAVIVLIILSLTAYVSISKYWACRDNPAACYPPQKEEKNERTSNHCNCGVTPQGINPSRRPGVPDECRRAGSPEYVGDPDHPGSDSSSPDEQEEDSLSR